MSAWYQDHKTIEQKISQNLVPRSQNYWAEDFSELDTKITKLLSRTFLRTWYQDHKVAFSQTLLKLVSCAWNGYITWIWPVHLIVVFSTLKPTFTLEIMQTACKSCTGKFSMINVVWYNIDGFPVISQLIHLLPSDSSRLTCEEISSKFIKML